MKQFPCSVSSPSGSSLEQMGGHGYDYVIRRPYLSGGLHLYPGHTILFHYQLINGIFISHLETSGQCVGEG